MVSRRRFLLAAGGALVGPSAAVASQGTSPYGLPEESEPHVRTFMQWPVNRMVHSDAAFLEDLQTAIADIANTIVEFEPVVMLMAAKFEAAARRKLGTSVEIWHIATDDLWCWDSGPLFVRNAAGDLAVRDLNFNGWGGKQVHPNDGRVARRVAQRLGLPVLGNGLVGEAGGVESDGQGTLIAHESSWINPNRNRGPKSAVSALLLEALGAEKVIWAPGVKGADITDYHIDSLARLVAPGTVLIQLPEQMDPRDPWSVAAFETYDILELSRDAREKPLHLVTIPEPVDTRIESADFVASYVNYYICNGAVIAAEFGDPEADTIARQTLSKLYPGREIVMLNVDPIGEVGGGIHCATQQQPVARNA